MSLLLYISGEPGVGKSTLMAELTRLCDRTPVGTPQPAHDVLSRGGRVIGAELGRRRPAFSGTDALPMNAHPGALEWISQAPYPLVLAEGSRLMTSRFLLKANAAGYRVAVVRLVAAPEVVAARRAQRGSKQNETWIRGTATRARNFAEDAATNRFDVIIPQQDAPAGIADQVIGCIPELGALR